MPLETKIKVLEIRPGDDVAPFVAGNAESAECVKKNRRRPKGIGIKPALRVSLAAVLIWIGNQIGTVGAV